MKKTVLALLFIVAILPNCKQSAKEVPKCINEAITEFEKKQPCTNIQIEEYVFQGNIVYVINQGSFSPVVDKDCNTIGALGGFAGNTEINGESFSNAEFVKIIWKNQC